MSKPRQRSSREVGSSISFGARACCGRFLDRSAPLPISWRVRASRLGRSIGCRGGFRPASLTSFGMDLLRRLSSISRSCFSDLLERSYPGRTWRMRSATAGSLCSGWPFLIALATIIWVPIGVAVGLRPALAEKVQPIAQFLAAFPANLFFPLVVYLIVRFQLSPIIWLSPLMILGTQWYILFNVIAGASVFPTDLREAAATFRIRRWRWWRDVMLPGIFPYFVTGAITASGGAWNASIVSEAVSWGPTKLNGLGLGAYIAQMTEAGDYPRIALGIAVMSVLVVATNRLLWRPLYAYAERRTRLD
jgi:ABC-type nitrate/sulfonate/bicarbonate transport system permease component